MQCNIKPFSSIPLSILPLPQSTTPSPSNPCTYIFIILSRDRRTDRPTDSRLLHPGTDPHLFDLLFILHHQTPGLQDLLQRLHDTLERRLGALFLREAGNGDIGAAAAVEEGVEFGGYRERGNAESCE